MTAMQHVNEKKEIGPALGYDPMFGGLDLSGCPSAQAPVSDSFIDERFAPLDTAGFGRGSAALKKFLSDPGRKAIEETRDPELIAEYNRQHAVSVVHVGDTDFRVYFKGGLWRGKGVTPDGTLHRFTGDSRDEVLAKLAKLSQQVKRETIHELTRAQEIEIARLCSCGQRHEGGTRYLRYRIGQERADSYNNPQEMIADPSLQGVFSECAKFCWLNSRPDVQDSQEFQAFLTDYAGSRPLTFDLLDSCWAAFGPHQEKLAREEAVSRFTNPPEPSPDEIAEGLEDMSDAEITKQFYSVAKAHARAAR